MAQATFIVHVESGPDARARVELAAGLAHRFGAALIGVAARDYVPLMPPPAGNPFPAAVARAMAAQDDEIRAELAAAEALFRVVAGRHEVESAWRSSIAPPAQTLARQARSADLLAVGRSPAWATPSSHADPGDVLMQAGRPVLIVPPGLSRLEAARVVVAWKDAREARRAVSDALLLLERASGVLVVGICRAAEARRETVAAVEDVARHLVRHGVAAEAEVQEPDGDTVGEALVLAAERYGADLIVAGGYGHTRLSEWVFGGVTRSLLRHCPKCCLLSH